MLYSNSEDMQHIVAFKGNSHQNHHPGSLAPYDRYTIVTCVQSVNVIPVHSHSINC
jgi:hypothetical protein